MQQVGVGVHDCLQAYCLVLIGGIEWRLWTTHNATLVAPA